MDLIRQLNIGQKVDFSLRQGILRERENRKAVYSEQPYGPLSLFAFLDGDEETIGFHTKHLSRQEGGPIVNDPEGSIYHMGSTRKGLQ
ncbi:hypothetical protein CMI48_03585 [Candidatus Pacearchaeota archaeon]|nr:hypothetical protein [Candidatus Pacearchaeota archaeon]